MEKIELIISPDGKKVVVKPTGFIGAACEAATKGIEAALGETVSTDHTPEYYQKTRGGQQSVSGR